MSYFKNIARVASEVQEEHDRVRMVLQPQRRPHADTCRFHQSLHEIVRQMEDHDLREWAHSAVYDEAWPSETHSDTAVWRYALKAELARRENPPDELEDLGWGTELGAGVPEPSCARMSLDAEALRAKHHPAGPGSTPTKPLWLLEREHPEWAAERARLEARPANPCPDQGPA